MKYIIQIPEPCNENWDEMTPTEKGRYCGVCKKEIYDFTNLTDRELVDRLENNKNVCAKYRKSQLNKDLYSNKNTGISKVGLLVSITSILSFSQQSFAQIDSTKVKTENRIDLNKKRHNQKENAKIDSIRIKGIVRDENGPLPCVNVLQKGTANGVATDFDGKFEITVSRERKNERIVLQISYIGYQDTEIEINDSNKVVDVKIIELKEEIILMGIVVVKKRNIFQRIGDLFRRKKQKTTDNKSNNCTTP